MTDFEGEYFRKFRFAAADIKRLVSAAERDLNIAERFKAPEVVFKFSYDALIKLGIAVVAHEGYRVRSAVGHHTKIIEKLSVILADADIETIGNVMRQKRNLDLYDGDGDITEKESSDYLDFAKRIAANVRDYLK